MTINQFLTAIKRCPSFEKFKSMDHVNRRMLVHNEKKREVIIMAY